MKNIIVVDSCCDMTESMKEEMGIFSVPLSLMLGQKEFIDDASLDLSMFMQSMKACTEKVGSASPSPYLYQEAVQNTASNYIVTLSSKLSGSYGNAVLGNRQAQEATTRSAHVFDSKSASAGETLIAIKLHEMLEKGLPKSRIIEETQRFIDHMKTYFLLENYNNLQKNGRLGKVTGSLIQLMNIKLIMGSNGDGEITLFEKVRGMKRALRQLLALIEKSEKKTEGETLVLSHNNNHGLAEQLAYKIKERFAFGNVYIVPTGGLSSLYADDKGIVIAF